MCSLFNSRLKGQVELIAIAGIVIVAAVVAILTMQQPITPTITVPQDIQQEQNAIENFMSTVIKSSADDSLKVIEAHGGYLTSGILGAQAEIVPFTVFLDDGVPYWQHCDDTSGMPSKALIADLLGTAVARSIIDNVDQIQSISGSNVVIDSDSLSVTINILEDKIQVSVFLPVTVDGYPMEQPFSVEEIQTNLGKIYDFARDFSIEMVNTRPFEVFTEYAIRASRTLPTTGILTDCGPDDDVHLSGQDVNVGLERAVRAAVHPSLWTSMVDQSGQGGLGDIPKIFTIETVNGKEYPDLEIRFDLPDNYEITGSTSIDIENPDVVMLVPGLASEGLETTDVCLVAYNYVYGVAYPVIISAFDDPTGRWFRFATFVHLGTGPVGGVNGQEINNDLTGSYNQLVADSNFTRQELESQLSSQGLEGNNLQDALNNYDAETQNVLNNITGNSQGVQDAGDEVLDMIPGNCQFG